MLKLSERTGKVIVSTHLGFRVIMTGISSLFLTVCLMAKIKDMRQFRPKLIQILYLKKPYYSPKKFYFLRSLRKKYD